MADDIRNNPEPLKPEHIETLIQELEEADAADPFLIKRRFRRWNFRCPADLYLKDENGQEIRLYASCRDISPIGVGLVCKQPIKAGTVAQIVLDLGFGKYIADVRIVHCTQTVGGFKIGAEFIFEQQPAAAGTGPDQAAEQAEPVENPTDA